MIAEKRPPPPLPHPFAEKFSVGIGLLFIQSVSVQTARWYPQGMSREAYSV